MKKLIILGLALSLVACKGDKKGKSTYNQSRLSDEGLLKSMAIYQGVSVEGIDLTGANKLVAKELLQEKFEKDLDKEVKLTYEDKDYKLTLRDLGYFYDYDKIIEEAYSLGREGEAEKRLEDIKNLKREKKNFDLEPSFSEDKARESLAAIRDETKVGGEGGKITYDPDQDKLTAKVEDPGKAIDLKDAVAKVKGLDFEKPGDIAMVSEKVLENEEANQLISRVNGMVSSSVSYFGTWFWERAENVRLSTAELNGMLIMPGETFSFNEYIGDTPYERGYQDAVIIQGTTEVPGKGGGVCQTSTGLYQAALRAGLEIVERHPHTLIMPYSDGGLDAAVDYGLIDLKLRNPYDFPVLFKTYYVDQGNGTGEIHFEVWGDTDVVKEEYEIYSTWNYDVEYDTIHAATEDGMDVAGVTGSSWTAYRENPETGEEEYLNDTYYPAVDAVINPVSEPEDYYEEPVQEDYYEEPVEEVYEEPAEENIAEEDTGE